MKNTLIAFILIFLEPVQILFKKTIKGFRIRQKLTTFDAAEEMAKITDTRLLLNRI